MQQNLRHFLSPIMADLPGSRTAVRGVSLLIVLQILSRAITFFANQLLLRYLTAELLGVSTQLEVYCQSVLFFSRESLRVAIQRQDVSSTLSCPSDTQCSHSDSSSPSTAASTVTTAVQSAINMSYLSILLGFPLSFLFGFAYLGAIDPSLAISTPNLSLGTVLYGIAALVELAAEPAFVVLQQRLHFATRGRAESLASFARCATTLFCAMRGASPATPFFSPGILPFAFGQLAYAIVLLGIYVRDALKLTLEEKDTLIEKKMASEGGRGFSLLPTRIAAVDNERKKEGKEQYWLGYWDMPTLHLAASMSLQSVVKYILTQGDTLLVSILSTTEAVGVYALVSNYGGLIARLIFQPVEESSRSYFSRLLASSTFSFPLDKSQPDSGLDAKTEETSQKSPVATAGSFLLSLFRLYIFFSLPVMTLGPIAAPHLLSIVAGSRFGSRSAAGDALAVYTLYIPLLALNGVSEAFVSSVASQDQIHAQSAVMVFFTVIFSAIGFITLRVLDWGACGLVVANGVNMISRIVWSAWFIRNWFTARGKTFGIENVLPGQMAIMASALAGSVAAKIVSKADMAMIALFKVAGVAVPYGLIL